MGWQQYFKVKGVRPGRIITFRHGELDFRRDDIPVDVIQDLFEHDFPYLKLTDLGKQKLYMDENYNPSAREVIDLIKGAATVQDVQLLVELKPDSVTVERAAAKRLDELSFES